MDNAVIGDVGDAADRFDSARSEMRDDLVVYDRRDIVEWCSMAEVEVVMVFQRGMAFVHLSRDEVGT